MSETNMEAKTAVSYPKKAEDIQKFCFKEFSNMPTTIASDEARGTYVCGPSKTFIIFLDTPEGDIISMSLLGDVAQSCLIYGKLKEEFGLEMTAPFCEDATDGQIKFDEEAYVALIKTRSAEAMHNLQQAQQQVAAEKGSESSIVGADGQAINKDGPQIITG